MSSLDRIDEIKNKIEDELEKFIPLKTPVSLYEPMRYALTSGGKRLRPVLVVLASEMVGGNINDSLYAAIAVELLHNFTLVHDDIMDQDDLRRGRVTVHKKWNESVAILSGDGLLALAYESLLRIRSPQIQLISTYFTQALLEVCEGQALDSEFENREQVGLNEYFLMIEKKTAKLFAMSCQIGALCGGGSLEEAEKLSGFGGLLGRAFQIQDDLLDITSDEKILGKNFGSDIRQGKKTYLLLHALNNADRNDRARIHEILNFRKAGEAQAQEIQQIFKRSGTIDTAKQEISNALELARESLNSFSESNARRIFTDLVDKLANRNY